MFTIYFPINLGNIGLDMPGCDVLAPVSVHLRNESNALPRQVVQLAGSHVLVHRGLGGGRLIDEQLRPTSWSNSYREFELQEQFRQMIIHGAVSDDTVVL